MYRDKILF